MNIVFFYEILQQLRKNTGLADTSFRTKNTSYVQNSYRVQTDLSLAKNVP